MQGIEEHSANDQYMRIKTELHKTILEEIDLDNLDRVNRETALRETRGLIQKTLKREDTPLSFSEREKLVDEILHELFGLGPLEPLLDDPSISDILVNGHGMVYVERHGILEKTTVRFNDDDLKTMLTFAPSVSP